MFFRTEALMTNSFREFVGAYFKNIQPLSNYDIIDMCKKPKKRWFDEVRTDCAELGLSTYEAVCATQDRAHWRGMLEELPRRISVSQRP